MRSFQPGGVTDARRDRFRGNDEGHGRPTQLVEVATEVMYRRLPEVVGAVDWNIVLMMFTLCILIRLLRHLCRWWLRGQFDDGFVLREEAFDCPGRSSLNRVTARVCSDETWDVPEGEVNSDDEVQSTPRAARYEEILSSEGDIDVQGRSTVFGSASGRMLECRMVKRSSRQKKSEDHSEEEDAWDDVHVDGPGTRYETASSGGEDGGDDVTNLSRSASSGRVGFRVQERSLGETFGRRRGYRGSRAADVEDGAEGVDSSGNDGVLRRPVTGERKDEVQEPDVTAASNRRPPTSIDFVGEEDDGGARRTHGLATSAKTRTRDAVDGSTTTTIKKTRMGRDDGSYHSGPQRDPVGRRDGSTMRVGDARTAEGHRRNISLNKSNTNIYKCK